MTLSGNRALGADLHYLDYLPDYGQPRGAAKYVRLSNNVPAKLGCGPCWTNGGKDKNELGTFLKTHLFKPGCEESYVAR